MTGGWGAVCYRHYINTRLRKCGMVDKQKCCRNREDDLYWIALNKKGRRMGRRP